MRPDLLPYLRCPVCAECLAAAGAALRCTRGHSFDVARQGYVNLLTGHATGGGDDAAMVAARADLLAAGHFDFLRDAVIAAAATGGDDPYRGIDLVVEVGAGTGHYLAGLLDAQPGGLGLALDVSKAAC